MNRRLIYQILSGLLLLLGMAACSEEVGGGGEEPEVDPRLESVTLHIGAAGTATTRAGFGGDDNARKGEFMNSLRVFIVDETGMIEKAIAATDSASFKADLETEGAGCVTNYTTTVDLLPGRKMIYAFANMDKVNRVGGEETATFDDELAALKDGDTWPNMSGYVLSDPASGIDLKENFIPMSVRQEVDLTVDNQQVSVALVRLVGRVDVVVNNQQGDVTIQKLAMSDFADRVFLFEQTDGTEDVPTETSYKLYEKDFGDGIFVPMNTTVFQLDTFYVNETFKRDNPFRITLTMADATMGGNTVASAIVRNHILPLQLNLSDVGLELTVTAQIAPIGGYPVTVYTTPSPLTDNYAVTLPEGCTFTVSGKLVTSGSSEKEITNWSWWIEDQDDNPNNNVTSNDIVALDGGVENISGDITGHLTALSAQTVTLGFQIYDPNVKQGTLTITTEVLRDWTEYKAGSSLTPWLSTPHLYEPIHLTLGQGGRR